MPWGMNAKKKKTVVVEGGAAECNSLPSYLSLLSSFQVPSVCHSGDVPLKVDKEEGLFEQLIFKVFLNYIYFYFIVVTG